MSINKPNITNDPLKAASGAAAANNLQNQAQNKINNAQNSINQISQEQQDKFNNLSNSLQEQTDAATSAATSAAKAAVVGIITSLLVKFINNDKIIDTIISNLIKKTKKKLNNKGRIEVKNKSVVIFYPKFIGNYSPYKNEFERKRKNLLKIVKTMKTIIDSLVVVLKLIKTALTILQLQLKVRKKKLLVTAAASAPDLSSISPSKPVAAQYPINKEIDDQVTKDLETKIENYILLITFVQNILKTLQQVLTRAKAKVERLSFNLYTEQSLTTLERTGLTKDEETGSTIYNNGNKNYIIEVITTPAGDLQAVAYDAFSRLKITQTAPSKTRGADELIDELKLILG